MAQRQFSPSQTHFSSASLVRQLASLDIVPAGEPAQTFAERLGHWIAWTDAVALSQVLADTPAAARDSGDLPRAAARPRQAREQLDRLRQDLGDGIAGDPLLRSDAGGPGVPADAVPMPGAGPVDFAAFRRQYRAHQHTMEDRIGRLRAAVRKAVAGQSPAMGRLAALDAVFDQALGAQLRRQLEQVPLMLEKSFQARRRAVGATPSEQETDLTRPAPQPPSWPAVGPTLQRMLLAELELRLQPVQGLIDALGPAVDATPS